MHTKKRRRKKKGVIQMEWRGEKKGIELVVCEISILDVPYIIKSGIYEP
jgi:hypothetical protein